jgi:hypothetical protein
MIAACCIVAYFAISLYYWDSGVQYHKRIPRDSEEWKRISAYGNAWIYLVLFHSMFWWYSLSRYAIYRIRCALRQW